MTAELAPLKKRSARLRRRIRTSCAMRIVTSRSLPRIPRNAPLSSRSATALRSSQRVLPLL
jgi:hypothetical protein